MKPVLIVASPYYTDIHAMLLEGALRVIKKAGFKHEIMEVPGALEIPIAISMAHTRRKFSGYVALGCVIRGETFHFEIVASESASGLSAMGINHCAAIGNGILTTENMAQAIERADPNKGDKGGEAARAALALIALKKEIGAPE